MIPKFRGRCPDGGWIHGSCVKFDENTCFIMPEFGGASTLSYAQIFNHTAQYVDIETIGQSTSLKDKNGTEIYEGDIVHVLDSEQINQRDENGAFIDAFFEEIDEIDSVVFADGSFKLKRTGFDVCICRSVDVFKIIGNIYENPELLEVP